MKYFVLVAGLALLPCVPLTAETTAANVLSNMVEIKPNAAGVTLGQWHTVVRDVETTRKFWTLIGATPGKVDGIDVMKLHGVVIFLEKGEPTGPSVGSTVDHPGIRVPNAPEFVTKLKAAGIKMDPGAGTQAPGYIGMGFGMIYTPDDMKIEVIGDPSLKLPVASDHIHYFIQDAAVPELQAWYVKVFGAEPYVDTFGNINNPTPSALVPGVSLKFSKTRLPAISPTKGRALDHIGFEVKNLEAFCKKLEVTGIKLDQPYSKSRHKGFASAELTDPLGTSIELTEGLSWK